MWISRQKWEAMEKRVAALEATSSLHSEWLNFAVYSKPRDLFPTISFYYHETPEYISVKEVVTKIMERLGIELKYVKGERARVDVLTAAVKADEEK